MDPIRFLTMAGLNVPALKAALEWAKKNDPAQAAEIQTLLDQLDAPIQPAAILDLAAHILPEAANIVRGKLDPRAHAGDAA